MSSYTVSIDGNSSCLRTTLFPALNLRSDKMWEVALLDFTSYNSIPNVTEGINNQLHYYKNKDTDGNFQSIETVFLDTGSYEVESINEELQKKMGKENIEIKANNSLLRTEIKSKFYIDFRQPHSIGMLLGFSPSSKILEPNITHIGENTVNIIKVNTINIICNIVHGSYKNGANQHILHTFYPTVAPGFKIVEKPHNLVYLPLNTTFISDIEVNILDQDEIPVDFRGEDISLRLHIRATN
jgi:hypothetical protein